MVHSYIYYDWLIRQATVNRVRTWDYAQTGVCFCVCCQYSVRSPFSIDWPRSFMHMYWQTHIDSQTISLSHTVMLSCLSSTHIPTAQSTLTPSAKGIRLPHTGRPFMYQKPFIHMTPRALLYYEMNGVTSRQCQGKGNVSVPPWWAFLRRGSLQLMTRAWRVLPLRGLARWPRGDGWREGRIQTVITGNHQLSQWISATLDWIAWPQTCDLSCKVEWEKRKRVRIRTKMKNYNRSTN